MLFYLWLRALASHKKRSTLLAVVLSGHYHPQIMISYTSQCPLFRPLRGLITRISVRAFPASWWLVLAQSEHSFVSTGPCGVFPSLAGQTYAIQLDHFFKFLMSPLFWLPIQRDCVSLCSAFSYEDGQEVQSDYIRFVVGDFAKLITQTLSITLMKLWLSFRQLDSSWFGTDFGGGASDIRRRNITIHPLTNY
jgi:hypothetical protein